MKEMKEIKNFSIFLKKLTYKILKNEEIFADNVTIEKRRQICNTCPLQKKSLFLKRCSLCGCITNKKSQFLFEECPDKPPKW